MKTLLYFSIANIKLGLLPMDALFLKESWKVFLVLSFFFPPG